jgi:hypothetical protein
MKKASATQFERTYPWQLAKSGVAIENSFPKSAKTDLRRVAKTFFEPPGNEVLETRIAGRSDQTSNPIDRINASPLLFVTTPALNL